jgi:hypothetical protein
MSPQYLGHGQLQQSFTILHKRLSAATTVEWDHFLKVVVVVI